MKKALLGFLILSLIGTAGSALFTMHELSRMFGGLTDVAEFDAPARMPERYALTNVRILSPSGDTFSDAGVVVINQQSIGQIGDTSLLTDGLTAIDGNGAFLIPGLIDSHVHLWESENDLLLYLANGVTQIREMNGSAQNLRWKAEIENGRLGPQMFVVAPQVASFSGPFGWFSAWTQRKTNVHSADDIEAAIKEFSNQGYDATKASSFLDKQGYQTLSALTGGTSLPMVGHLPMAIGLSDLWNSNQSEIAHVEELAKALDREFGGYDTHNIDEYLKFVERRAPEIAQKVHSNRISVTSTLGLIDSFPNQKSNLAGTLDSVELAYANPGITEGTVITSRGMGWLPDVNIYRWPDDITENQKKASLDYWTAYSKAQHIVLDALVAEGVPILLGTDTNVPTVVPGFSVHDELEVLVATGMNNAQALASATRNPANFMKTKTGEIREGYRANMVLLRDNPLENIGATRSIEMVFVNGRALQKADLNGMLKAVRDANDNSRTQPIDLQ